MSFNINTLTRTPAEIGRSLNLPAGLPLDPTKLVTSLVDQAKNGADPFKLFDQVKDQLSPLGQGEVLRGLDKAFAAGLPGWNPVDDLIKAGKGLIDFSKKSLEWLKGKADDLMKTLGSLPNKAANELADSMRGPNARKLTSGEVNELRKIFGNDIDLSNVRIVNGPGNNPAAAHAFKNDTPAMAVGNTVYMREDIYKQFGKDFSKSPEGIEHLVHEFAHVYQYQKMGFGSFAAKYAQDFAKYPNQSDHYNYKSRNTTYKTETIEGQAQMIGHYAQYLAEVKAGVPADERILKTQADVKDLERRLAGTGLFGL
jgi:hypothetical protein